MPIGRRERLKQELREEILAAARGLFVQEGYGSVSIRKIADTVGCAPGTIYLYFEDKAAILSAICVETFAKLSKHMEAIALDPSDPLERLRRGGRVYVQFALDHPHHYWLTFAMNRSDVSKDNQVKEAGNRCFDGLRNCIRACVEAGVLRSNDVEQMAQSVWACTHGIVMLLLGKAGFPFIEQNRLIDSVVDITIEGIRKRD